jgi:hypothetical protein
MQVLGEAKFYVRIIGESFKQQRVEISASADDALNQHIVALDSIQDEILIHRKHSEARPKLVSSSAGVRILLQQLEPFVDGFEEPIRCLEAAAARRRSTRSRQRRHELAARSGAPSARRGGALCLDSTTKTVFGIFDESLHGFLRNGNSLAAREFRVGFVKHRKNFETPAFALFPQRQRLLNGILFAGEATALDGFLYEHALVGSELHVHKKILAQRLTYGRPRGFMAHSRRAAVWILTLATTTYATANASAPAASAEVDLTTIEILTTGGNARSRLAIAKTTLAISPAVLAIRGNRTAASTDTIHVMMRAGPTASAATFRVMPLPATWTCREDASARSCTTVIVSVAGCFEGTKRRADLAQDRLLDRWLLRGQDMGHVQSQNTRC